MHEYLKDKQHYEDLYDLYTIKSCLITTDLLKEDKRKNKISKQAQNIASHLMLYVKTGERYRNKEKAIQEWMERDRKLDEKISNTLFPSYVKCPECNGTLKEESRHIDDITEPHPRIKFLAFCESCGKEAMFLGNGDRYEPPPSLCPKCHMELKTKSKYSEEKDTITENCPRCDYKNITIYDFKKSREERESEEKKNKELLLKYRSEYCLSEKDGRDYIVQTDNINRLNKMMKEEDAKRKDPEYQKARSVKKITVTELQKMLKKKFEAESFINLNFENPQIDRYVIVPFTVQDSKRSRKKDTSVKDLRRILNFALENLNWRLMSEGIEYRMGYLKGKLKGYENEDELAKFIKKRDNKRPLFWDKDGPVY